jgi:hypothetical protein
VSGRVDELGLAAAPWLAAGLAAPGLAASCPIGLFALLLLLAVLLRRLVLPIAFIAVACALLGAAWSAHAIAARAADPLRVRTGALERVRLVITGQPRAGSFGSTAMARLSGHPVELRTRGILEQGAIVEVSGRLAPVAPSSGDFDRRTWLAQQGCTRR